MKKVVDRFLPLFENLDALTKRDIEMKFFLNFIFGGKRKRLSQEIVEQYIYSLLTREKALSWEEHNKILKVSQLLWISEDHTKQLIEKVSIHYYLATFLAGSINEQRFTQLQQRLQVFDATEVLDAKKVLFHRFLSQKYHEVLEKEYILPEEQQQLEVFAHVLHTQVQFDTTMQYMIQRAELNGRLLSWIYEPIEVSIQLQKGEHCFYSNMGTWLYAYTTTSAGRYVWSWTSFDLGVGMEYSTTAGEFIPAWEGLAHIDTGDFFLTDRRIIFMWDKQTLSILYKDILRYDRDDTYVVIHQANTQPISFDFFVGIDDRVVSSYLRHAIDA